MRYVEGRSYIEVTPEVMESTKFKTISTISVGKDVSDGMELKGNISFNELDIVFIFRRKESMGCRR